MRSAVKFAATTALILAGIPAAASGSNWTRFGEGGWLPALAIYGGATMQKHYGSTSSSCALGGEGDEPFSGGVTEAGFAPCQFLLPNPDELPTELRPAVSGSDWSVSPILGFDLELSTPAFDFVPGDPRLFFRGELQLAFPPLKTVSNEGNPTGARVPPDNNPNIQPELWEFPTLALIGVGSRITSEVQTLGWGAGAGIAFPFEFRGRRIWVKPGFAWTQYTVDVEYRVEAAIKNDRQEPVQVGSVKVNGNVLRQVSLRDSRTETFNGIGPSLELEMDVGHFGPVGASVFVNGGAYKVLGDTSVDLGSTRHYDETPGEQNPRFPFANIPEGPIPADDYTANGRFSVDPWSYRAAVGIRFHWFGF